MHVTIHTAACPDGTSTISNAALDRVRGSFNPSRNPAVDRVKALTAALISEMEQAGENAAGAREAATAATQFQGACMFAAAALTAEGLA